VLARTQNPLIGGVDSFLCAKAPVPLYFDGGCQTTLGELSKSGGQLLLHANRMGDKLMAGIRTEAAKYGISLLVTGFGAAFSIHFSPRLGQFSNFPHAANRPVLCYAYLRAGSHDNASL